VSPYTIWLLGLPAAAWLALGSLTAVGARRRGQRWFLACLSGLFFPLTWTVWYAFDERAATRSRRWAADE